MLPDQSVDLTCQTLTMTPEDFPFVFFFGQMFQSRDELLDCLTDDLRPVASSGSVYGHEPIKNR